MSREAPPATDPTPNGAAALPEGQASPPAAAEPQAPARPSRGTDPLPVAPAPAEPAAGPEISPEARRKIIEEIGDDDFRDNEAVRNRYNKFISSEKKKLEVENQKRSEDIQAHIDWDNYFRELERAGTDAFYQALTDPVTGPRDTQAWAVIQRWRGDKSVNNQWARANQEQVADAMVKNLLDHISKHEDWSHLDSDDIDKILGERDVPTALTRLLMAGTEKERKALRAKVDAEIQAGVNEALAKRGLSANEPEPPRGGVVGIGNGGLTLDAYNAMTPTERRDLRRNNPQAIDAMTTALQEAQLGGSP